MGRGDIVPDGGEPLKTPGRRRMDAIGKLQAATSASALRLGLRDHDVVVVGISGGPDSCALLDALHHANRHSDVPYSLRAAHLIHDFRGQEKYDDAEFVREFCQHRGLDLTVEEVDVAAYQKSHRVSSFEQAARDLRYAFLARVSRAVGARFTAVGHTADDQAETTLLHIARGSGLHGLRGMREIGPWPYPEGNHAHQLWRPLLTARRVDTINYCQQRGIPFRDDQTNYMEDFARNRVRSSLMPALASQLNPQIVDALGRLSRTATAQLDYLEEQAAKHWESISPHPLTAEGVLRIRRDNLNALHPALRPLILRKAWIAVTGDQKRLSEVHLHQLAQLAERPTSGKTAMLPGGYRARTFGNWLEVLPSAAVDDCPYPALQGPFRVTLPFGPVAIGITKRDGWQVTAQSATLSSDAALDTGEPWSAYLSAQALAEGATVRTWHQGDRIQPLGMPGHRKLQDLWAAAGIPKHWRERVPLVTTPRGIAWAVGVRISDWAAVRLEKNGTTRSVLLTFDRDPTVNDEAES